MQLSSSSSASLSLSDLCWWGGTFPDASPKPPAVFRRRGSQPFKQSKQSRTSLLSTSRSLQPLFPIPHFACLKRIYIQGSHDPRYRRKKMAERNIGVFASDHSGWASELRCSEGWHVLNRSLVGCCRGYQGMSLLNLRTNTKHI